MLCRKLFLFEKGHFCRETRGIAHLEQAEFRKRPDKSIKLALELTEIGEERHPANVNEVKVVIASCFARIYSHNIEVTGEVAGTYFKDVTAGVFCLVTFKICHDMLQPLGDREN